jgi:DNA-binding LacI/PurR family transcriptional regulator
VEREVNYLYDLGHRRMAFVSHHATLGPLSIREKAFRKTVERYAPEATWTSAASADGLDGGRIAARNILESGFDPTAIVCVNDFMAIGVLRELRDRKLRVPRDISVTGFDNIKLSEYCDPPLTTVHIPRDVIGRMVIDSLAGSQGDDQLLGKEFAIHPDFLLRESTGPVNR